MGGGVMLKSPIQYFGAKGTMAERIVALMPEHRGYIEPYAGSLSVLLAKSPAKIEVVNDVDEKLMTFWRVLRDRGEDLVRVAEMTPHSRQELERAAAFLRRGMRATAVVAMSRSGQGRRSGTSMTRSCMPGVWRLRVVWRRRQKRALSAGCRSRAHAMTKGRAQMAYQATNWAWELDLPMAQKFVLIALADMADETMSCYPGQKRLARMVGSSDRTVRRALAELETVGVLVRHERRAEDGYRTSDRYELKVGAEPTKALLDNMAGSGIGADLTGQSDRSHRTNMSISPDIYDSLTGHSDRAIEPSVNHQRITSESPDLFELVDPAEGDLFEEFWSVWPRRDGKKAAVESWAKALKKINQHALLAAARAYASSPGRPERKYVPFASTWLNQERWMDDPPAAIERPESKDDRAMNVIEMGRKLAELGQRGELGA